MEASYPSGTNAFKIPLVRSSDKLAGEFIHRKQISLSSVNPIPIRTVQMQDSANLSRLFKHYVYAQILLILSISYGSGNAVAQRQKNYPPEFSGCKTETYKSIGETKLNLWIFEEENSSDQAAKPAIVFFYGGGWRAGTPAQFEHHCRYLAKQGMIAITADYRVLNRHQTLADRSVADAQCGRHV